MEKAFAKAEELFENANAYVNNRVEQVKLRVAEKSSAAFSYIVAGTIIAVVFALFFIFVSAALALGIGEWTGHTWLGFLLVGLLQLLFGALVWVNRERLIQMPMMNAMITHLFNNADEKDQEY